MDQIQRKVKLNERVLIDRDPKKIEATVTNLSSKGCQLRIPRKLSYFDVNEVLTLHFCDIETEPLSGELKNVMVTTNHYYYGIMFDEQTQSHAEELVNALEQKQSEN
nr:PilZ domain-containing protein [Vibrio sp. RE86]